jgi:acetyltransferase
MSSLDALFSPCSIAVVGASERPGSVARAVMENLRCFPGVIYPVNPRRAEVCGVPTWPSLRAIGRPVDLAVIITPAASVAGVMAECALAGVKAVVVISAGFKETGAAGEQMEREILAEARRAGIRLIGPNCLGVMVPSAGLNATFATRMAVPGRVAFLSQSGALGTAILDLSVTEGTGLSAFVSVGSMVDVGWGDLIRYFGDDPGTDSIVMYMESVGDATCFLAAAREVAARKPIVVIKVGRTAAAARAAASHTGAMTGSDAVFEAAMKQAGVLRVETIEELFDMAEVLAKQPLPRGPRLGIVTNAGGPGALAVDALVARGGEVAVLSPETLACLDGVLPPHWSHGDPVDVLGDADAMRFSQAVQWVAEDDGVDGVLVVLTPQSMTDPVAVAAAVAAVGRVPGKPLLCSWMGGDAVRDGRRVLNDAGISTHDYPDAAARVFAAMWDRRCRLDWLEAAGAGAAAAAGEWEIPEEVQRVLGEVRAHGRVLLTEAESKQILAAWGIPVVDTVVAVTMSEAVACAERFGYPVVVKLHSATITHKSDVGGVRLDLESAEAVRRAWGEVEAAVAPVDFGGVSVQRMVASDGVELILGAARDPQFGVVMLFGAGGTLVEVWQDRVLALPPLTRETARRWMAGPKIHRALLGIRGRPAADLEALIDVMVRFSAMMLAMPSLVEVDLNPVVATARGVVVLDARMILAPPV